MRRGRRRGSRGPSAATRARLLGTVAFALLAAATVAQTATSRLSPQVRLRLGLAGGAAGLILLAGIVAGAGSGMLIKSAIGTVAAMAAAPQRGEALSGLFLICYAGMSLPAIGVGIAVQYISLTVAMYSFCGASLLVLAGATLLTHRGRPSGS